MSTAGNQFKLTEDTHEQATDLEISTLMDGYHNDSLMAGLAGHERLSDDSRR